MLFRYFLAVNMSDPGPFSTPDSLIESIYRAALEPGSYDAFMLEWDGYVSQRLAALEALKDSDPTFQAPEFEKHFEIASQLIERAPQTAPAPGQLVSQIGAPQFLIDASGQVVWRNGASADALGLQRRDAVDRLPLPPHQAAALKALVADLSSDLSEMRAPLLLQLQAPNGGKPIHLRAERFRYAGSTDVILVAGLEPVWPPLASQMLTDSYGLSASECEVAGLVAEGLPPATIAERRGASVATVRTQVKKIMSKTGTNAQGELTALLNNIRRLAERHDLKREETLGPDGRIATARIGDRRMDLEFHGPETGDPVIFLHGMLDGTAFTRSAQELLAEYNLRFICPHRPSFGQSDPDPGLFSEAPQRFARDLKQVCGQLGVTQPVVVGHMAGSVYAFAASQVCEPRGIVCVSGGVPITSRKQISAMTRRQRLVAFTALHAPNMLPYVLRAGIHQLKSGGDKRFLTSLYENAPVDFKVTQDPEIRRLILDGYQFTVRQGHRAFEIDSHQVVRDWSHLTAGSDAPVHLIHGAHDSVVTVDSVREFSRSLGPRAELTVLDEAGQLLFYQSPRVVLDAIRAQFACSQA